MSSVLIFINDLLNLFIICIEIKADLFGNVLNGWITILLFDILQNS